MERTSGSFASWWTSPHSSASPLWPTWEGEGDELPPSTPSLPSTPQATPYLCLHLPAGDGGFAIVAWPKLEGDGAGSDVGDAQVGGGTGELCGDRTGRVAPAAHPWHPPSTAAPPHSPGGTPEEMVEEESWPWPLEVMAATSMV